MGFAFIIEIYRLAAPAARWNQNTTKNKILKGQFSTKIEVQNIFRMFGEILKINTAENPPWAYRGPASGYFHLRKAPLIRKAPPFRSPSEQWGGGFLRWWVQKSVKKGREKGAGAPQAEKNKVFARRRRAENAKNGRKVTNFNPNQGFLEVKIFTI